MYLPRFLLHALSYQNRPNVIIAAEPIMVHHLGLQDDLPEVQTRDLKLERLVEDGKESVSSDRALPLVEPLVFVYQIHFDIGI